MDEEKTQILLDRVAIADLVTRYAAGMDFQDWKLFQSCLIDELEVDYSEATGQPARTLKANNFVAYIRNLLSKEDLRVQTLISNLSMTHQGNTATCLAYYVAQHYLPQSDGADDCFNVHGWYDFSLIRTELSWKMSKIKVTVRWSTGTPSMLNL